MATIAGLNVPPELLILFRELMRMNDARRYGSVAKHGYLLSKERKRNISTRSLLPEISALWRALPDSAKNDWKLAGAQSGYNSWNLFVQDTAYRLKFGLPDLANPSQLHQYKVGRLEINAPADQAELKQYHPESYYVLKRDNSINGKYIDVKIEENLILPFEFGMSYRTNMVATAPEYIAKFFATVYSSYQGRTIETNIEIDLDLQQGWTRASGEILDVIGTARSYDLTIKFENVRGSFEWDNVLSKHTGTNFARDYRCSDVNNELTRSNYQIEKSWEEVILPTGAAFDSVYPQDAETEYRYYGLAQYGDTP